MIFKRIVAICGAKGSGKDETGSILVKGGGEYERLKFATPLKDSLKVLFGFDEEQVEGSSKEIVDERWGITPRSAMQFFGTEIMQQRIQDIMPGIGREFFARRLVTLIKERPRDQRFVITDMRFPHEADLIRREFHDEVFIIKIMRSNLDASDSHLSERAYLDIEADATITNDSTIDDLITALESSRQTCDL